MTTSTFHYIYDPLCGWCYGAAPLIAATAERFPLVLHGAGMMSAEHRQTVTPALRDYIVPHDQRIAELSGQPFGRDYHDGLLRDDGALFDSDPPITAILAAEQLAARGHTLLSRLQRAHYVEGRRIADVNVLRALANDIGLDGADFTAAFDRLSADATRAHIEASRRLLARLGGHGFPTLAIERDGTYERVDLGPYFGRLDAWIGQLPQTPTNAVKP